MYICTYGKGYLQDWLQDWMLYCWFGSYCSATTQLMDEWWSASKALTDKAYIAQLPQLLQLTASFAVAPG